MEKKGIAAKRMSYEEFLAWCDEDTLAEWVDGEVVMYSPPSRRHQEVQKFLLGLLDAYVHARDLGIVLGAPFQMHLGPLRRGREPDVLFIRKENLSRLRDTYLEGPADLVVEVASEESRLRDYGEKLAEYELGGVGEYWIVDPERNEVRFFQRKGGRFIPVFPDAEGLYRSAVIPGLWIKVEWLLADPLPPVLDALRKLRVIP